MTDAAQRNDTGAEPVLPPTQDAHTSRRSLLGLGLGAAAGAAALAAGTASPAGATPTPTAIHIDATSTGTGGTTILQYTSGGSDVGAAFRSALQDWGGQVYNVRAYGAKGNGTTFDTTGIKAAQIAAGAGCVYFPPGTYLTKGLKITHAGQTFKLESGATILATSGIVKPVILATATGVTVLGPGTVDGNATGRVGTLMGFSGIKFTSGADDGRVEGVVVQRVAWIGIEFSQANRGKIVVNRVLSCAHSGIVASAIGASITGPLVLGNFVKLTATTTIAGISINGSSPTHIVNFPTISANEVGVGDGICYQLQNCQYARVVGNRGEGPDQVFSLAGGTDNVVSGNTAQATGTGCGIEFGCNNSTCAGNTVLCSGASGGIHVDNGAGAHVAVTGNKIIGAQHAGIGVGSYHHVTITGNVIVQSASASTTYGIIQIAPTSPGMIVIADNICDGAGASGYGIWLNNLTAMTIMTSIHDNAVAGIKSGSTFAAIRLAGAGTFTDLIVHDNTVAASIPLFSKAGGTNLGSNVRFHNNIVVGQGVPGLSKFTLPASGTPYVNTGPFTEIVYLQGGKLSGTGLSQGVNKNAHTLVPAGVVLKTPLSVELQPGESVTVYYTTAPTAHRDVKI